MGCSIIKGGSGWELESRPLTFAARINHPQALPGMGLPPLLFKTLLMQTPQSRQPAQVLYHPTIKDPYLT